MDVTILDIERALLEHYEPYSADADVPRLELPERVWRHVAPVRVQIEPLGGVETVEIAYRTDWDPEHTVGARCQGWALIELNACRSARTWACGCSSCACWPAEADRGLASRERGR